MVRLGSEKFAGLHARAATLDFVSKARVFGSSSQQGDESPACAVAKRLS